MPSTTPKKKKDAPKKRPPRDPWRPTKYKPKVLKQAWQYYERHRDPQNAHLLPTLMELAIELEISERTLEYWCKKHKDFLRAIRRIKTLQKLRLTQMGVEKDKPLFEMFLLKANHKMVEYKPIDDRDLGDEINLRIRVIDETKKTGQ